MAKGGKKKIRKRELNQLVGLRKATARLTGARICFGKPITVDGRTVIPVARVRAFGGWGSGSGMKDGEPGEGGGGGGMVDGRPVGFIEISDGGTRFESIDPAGDRARVMATLGVAAVASLKIVVARRRELKAVKRAALKRVPLALPRRLR